MQTRGLEIRPLNTMQKLQLWLQGISLTKDLLTHSICKALLPILSFHHAKAATFLHGTNTEQEVEGVESKLEALFSVSVMRQRTN